MAVENRDFIRAKIQQVGEMTGTKQADLLLAQAIDLLLKELLDVMSENFELRCNLVSLEAKISKHLRLAP